ncbi:uncharacterized protein LOC124264405 [Haliotis rubra]|uniref:uncharacterized protein LOC124264405 n=1 Tax=Haliotis rubra TaxID=36100 RepID=UPI001EE56631|nr:uncharacterized protein LOC124264405 [Haliotis rubra]
MNNRGCNKVEACLTVANIFGVFAIVIIAAAIGTDRWLVFTVNRSRLSAATQVASREGIRARYYHTRQRGMFRECYPGNDTVFLDKATDVLDKNCFSTMFGDNPDGASEDYRMMQGLFTAFMVMFIVGELVLVIAYIIGLCLCVGRLFSKAWVAALLTFIAAFLVALGLALFHGSVHVERENVRDTLTDRQQYYQSWPTELQNSTKMAFKESYIAAWVGFVLMLVTCFCYGIAARLLSPPKPKSKAPPPPEASYYPQQVIYPTQQASYPQAPVVYYLE